MQKTQERRDAMAQKTKNMEGVIDWRENQAADYHRVEEVKGVHEDPGVEIKLRGDFQGIYGGI